MCEGQRILSLAATLAVIAGSAACSRGSDATMRPHRQQANAAADPEIVREFVSLFPDSVSYVSYSTGAFGTPTRVMTAALHGRVLLTMRLPLQAGPNGEAPKARFWLLEVEEIVLNEDGSVGGETYTDNQLEFGEEEWARLVRAKGDLTSVGFQVMGQVPLPGFEQLHRSHDPH